MSLGNSSADFLRRVDTRDQLFSPRFKNGEEIRVCSSVPLRGDFDRAAVRVAQVLDRRQHNKPIEERRGYFHFFPEDVKGRWRFLKAKYNPFGGMLREERVAFDVILDDLDLARGQTGIDCPRVRVIYSNIGTTETSFHRDYNGSFRLLRAYNHSAMSVTDRANVFSCCNMPNSYSVFDEKRVIPIQIGDYTLHRMMTNEDEQAPSPYGAYHKATVKERGLIPRLLLCCD